MQEISRSAIVERHTGPLSEALGFLMEHATLFQKINNQIVKGGYHQTLGNVLKNLWESERPGDYLDRALVEYAAASYHFEKAEHRCYRANVENNLAFLYFKVNRCKEAHEHLDKARRILNTLKDRDEFAKVDETRARVFLKQKRTQRPKKAHDRQYGILENSEGNHCSGSVDNAR